MSKEIDFICEVFENPDSVFIKNIINDSLDLYELTVEQGVKDFFKIMRAKYSDSSEQEILEHLVKRLRIQEESRIYMGGN